MAHGQRLGVDGFLNAPSSNGKRSSFADGWKKNGQGNTTVWLHREMWASQSMNHPIPFVAEFTDRETKEKVAAVRTDRWNCHESDAVLAKRRFRTREGHRELPPVVCPACILTEVVIELVGAKKLDWLAPMFVWEGDDEDEKHVVRAAGIYNGFNAKDLSREERKQMRSAGIAQDESYRQSMLVRMQWLFLVAQAGHLDNGLGMTFEPDALGEKIKKAIRDEMKRCRPDEAKGNPALNPYPFEWTFDDSKEFSDKYDVVALSIKMPRPNVLALIDGPIPSEVDDALALGSCWELRANLEAHLVKGIVLPWDRIFGPAEKAGLMVPPQDSKEDADDEGGGSYDVRGTSAREVVNIGPDHDLWFEGAKPIDVKGKRVVLDAPEASAEGPAATDEEIEAATQLVTSWGAAEVGMLVMCDHCDAGMCTLDADCPACGAGYDDEGHLEGRPCLACKTMVETKGDGPWICGKCAQIHTLGPETLGNGVARWKAKAKEEAPVAGKRRRLGAEPAPAAEPEPKEPAKRQRRAGVPFDIGGGVK